MKNFASPLLCVLLAACVSEPVISPEKQQSMFNDALFAPPSERIDVNDIFALDTGMQTFLDHEVARKEIMEGKVMALYDSLYTSDHKKFAYDAVQTRNAADVFRLQSGNCLSYTIMTAAFAKQLHEPVQFHVVSFGEVWDRSDNIEFKIGHVNLTVGQASFSTGHDAPKLIDFGAFENTRGEILDDIGEDVIIAMYLNNRAAEALAKNQLDDAYWWARAAMVYTPSYIGAYNTMGVIYSRHQNLIQSELVFRQVLEREPDNVLAMSNQVQVLARLGRTDESSKLAQRLAEIQPNPPYFFFNLGLAAMRAHDYEEARLEFKKEVNRASYNHQFHFWLALANYYLGNFDETRKQLRVAMENSPNTEQHDLYAAKLEMMKSHVSH
ncbi:MAG TPA: tetratricopeptide repeat protein [Burkholderiaceae bacterium]|nr:tetratricopeptide repeat protein [Burkholderiaceae bacterium]